LTSLRTTLARWHRDERGQLGGGEVIPLGLLILVVGSLLVANAWAVIDAKSAATTAAREAVRSYVESTSPSTAAADAELAARDAITALGLDPQRLGPMELEVPAFERCERVTVRLTYEVPAIPLPWSDGLGDGLDVTASHREIIDPLRNNVPGSAGCIG
jgi:hypothetical protein